MRLSRRDHDALGGPSVRPLSVEGISRYSNFAVKKVCSQKGYSVIKRSEQAVYRKRQQEDCQQDGRQIEGSAVDTQLGLLLLKDGPSGRP